MSLPTMTDTNWIGLRVPVVSTLSADQTERIRAAFGLTAGDLPGVDQDTLAQYHAYPSVNLSLPLTAYYPQPANPQEKSQFRCTVLEVLDPTRRNTPWCSVPTRRPRCSPQSS